MRVCGTLCETGEVVTIEIAEGRIARMRTGAEADALGGPDSVRGYRPSELRGDQGWLGTVELRRQFQALNVPGVGHVFYDLGSAKARGFGGSDTIQSWGVGASVFPHRHLRAKVEYSHAISDRRSQDGKRERVWFTVTAAF